MIGSNLPKLDIETVCFFATALKIYFGFKWLLSGVDVYCGSVMSEKFVASLAGGK